MELTFNLPEDVIERAVKRAMAQVQQVAPLPRLTYSVHEAAEITSLSSALIRAAVASRHLKAHKVGTRTVIFAEDLSAWLRSFPSTQDEQI